MDISSFLRTFVKESSHSGYKNTKTLYQVYGRTRLTAASVFCQAIRESVSFDWNLAPARSESYNSSRGVFIMAELIENSLKTVFGRLIRERSMNDINVTMLCRETGISRRTFYNHYNSMADLCRQTIFCDLASTLQDNTGYDQWMDGFRSILYYGRANRKMFFHIFFSDYRSSLMTALDEYSHNIIRKAIRRCADDSRISVSSETINFMSDFNNASSDLNVIC